MIYLFHSAPTLLSTLSSPACEQELPTVRICPTLTLGSAYHSLCAAQPFPSWKHGQLLTSDLLQILAALAGREISPRHSGCQCTVGATLPTPSPAGTFLTLCSAGETHIGNKYLQHFIANKSSFLVSQLGRQFLYSLLSLILQQVYLLAIILF